LKDCVGLLVALVTIDLHGVVDMDNVVIVACEFGTFRLVEHVIWR